ncbi:hypothetical protein OS493_003030 [Desmophyllum pertusum]|uniref:Uncharacterized protein n=1 Tax=Desmophyllum pertusum TaxID=174260 RepID=A0A9X0CIC1_9CNID|nr:hypothetical protein OS493_003030 [Desmophyllum pertusum]
MVFLFEYLHHPVQYSARFRVFPQASLVRLESAQLNKLALETFQNFIQTDQLQSLSVSSANETAIHVWGLANSHNRRCPASANLER